MRLKGYLGTNKAEEILTEALYWLYIISMGTNDFLENYYALPNRQLRYTIEEYQNFLTGIARNFITRIYKLGARKISLTGLSPMGCFPLERTTNLISGRECIQKYNKVAKDFNKKLQALVSTLNNELSGIHLVFSNPYDMFYEIIQNPESFGFENKAFACCGTGKFEMSYLCDEYNPFTLRDANKYLFWDSFHPSEKTNAILTAYAVTTNLSVFI
ncbi:GDSL esterase/lipase [Abeliophyllum distichum]|uniref:GDSL esterase/lipase n=1 Tax=Abeliophyllum distichum TaxID=126358 RepID=A0ABD1QKJ3_9LAMI